MITLVFTYRNRVIDLVKNCFDSLANQTNSSFEVVVVNYGSNPKYTTELIDLVVNYPFIQVIDCAMVSQQLWNKSRAINMALQTCQSPSFFVGDIDMIFKENFVEILYSLQDSNQIHYFQVGFLDQNESQKKLAFSEYKINFLSNHEATGMTLYPTKILKSCNGYDEFYHGWGAEDTDVHVRLQKMDYPVEFYNQHVLILHQWHPKSYRTQSSVEPFHSSLEKINHQYLSQLRTHSTWMANQRNDWGVLPNLSQYETLKNPSQTIAITTEKNTVDACLNGTIFGFKNEVVQLVIKNSKESRKSVTWLKKKLKKKALKYYSLQEVNDKILLLLITNFRNNPYQFEYSKVNETITLQIAL